MRNLVCLLEEPSAEEMLKGVLPRILPEDVYCQYMVFEGKQDLEKRLEKRLRGWRMPDTIFLIMRDQDSGDCREIKKGLQEKVRSAGKGDVSLVRIACHELESFYLGDLAAVEEGLSLSGLKERQEQGKYRNPDALANPAEEMYKITDFQYQKIAGSRAIAPLLNLEGGNRSRSFTVLLEGIEALSI